MVRKQSVGMDDGTGNGQVPCGVIAQAEAAASSSSNIIGGPSSYDPTSGTASGANPDISSYQGPSIGSSKSTNAYVFSFSNTSVTN